jgi:hypothetical protein
MAESASLHELEQLYALLDENFDDLFAACKTKAQRNALRRAYVTARDNFYEAQNRIFRENDPLVSSMTRDLKEAKERIEGMLADLKTIVKVLDAITAGVNLGSSLITLGSTLL